MTYRFAFFSSTWSVAVLALILAIPLSGAVGWVRSPAVALAAPLALGGALLVARFPACVAFGLVAVLGLVPLDYIQALAPTTSALGLPLPVSPPIVAAVLIGVLAVAHRRAPSPTVRRVGKVAVLFVAMCAASLLFTEGDARPGAIWLYHFAIGLGLFVGVSALLTGRLVRQLVAWYVVVAGIAALYGLLEYALWSNPVYADVYADNQAVRASSMNQFYFPYGSWFGTGVYRITSTLGHPLRNGIFYASALPLAFAGVLFLPGYRRFVAVALFVTIAGGLAVTYARGSWLISLGLVALLFVAPIRYRSLTRSSWTRWVVVVPLVAAGLVLAVTVLGESVRTRLGAGLFAIPEVQTRLAFASEGLAVFFRQPILGTGLLVSEAVRVGWASYENSWITLLVDTGILGLGSFILLCGTIAVGRLRSLSAFRRLSVLQVATRASFFAFLLNLYTFNFMSGFPLFHWLFWLLAAFVVMADEQAESPELPAEAAERAS